MESRGKSGAAYPAAWVIPALVAVVVLVLSLLVLLGGRWGILGGADCTVTVAGRTVELGTEEAEDASVIAASSVRRGLPLRTTAAGVAAELGIERPDARAVASALTGGSPHALTCLHGGADDEASNRLNAAGLTKRAATARRDIEGAFGPQKLGGFASGGVSSGHMPGSAHYQGRAVDIFYRPVTGKSQAEGWALAQYLVANADRLELNTVIYDGRIWTARRAVQGWRGYQPDTSGRAAEVAAVLEHRDHVHLDVAD